MRSRQIWLIVAVVAVLLAVASGIHEWQIAQRQRASEEALEKVFPEVPTAPSQPTARPSSPAR